jgi:hypothetical protein
MKEELIRDAAFPASSEKVHSETDGFSLVNAVLARSSDAGQT